MEKYIEAEPLHEQLRMAIREYPSSFYDGIEVARSLVWKAPPADVRPVVHGEWIVDTMFGADVMSGGQMVLCSVCGKGTFYGKSNFCPHCGADMRGADKNGT